MKNNPKVSIVIPTYNRAKVLDRAIKSALSQTYDDFEIVIIDDASDDDTQSLVKGMKDERIRYFKHATNKGQPASRNTGIEKARGKYIAFLDSDDEWLSEKLEKQVKKIENSSEDTGLIYTRYWIVKDGKKLLSKKPKKKGYIFEDQLFEDYVTLSSCILAKKESLEKIGGFDERLPARVDYDVSLRLSKYYRFDYLQEPLVKVYHDEDLSRITARDAQKHIEAEQIILEKVKKEIKDWPEKKQRKCISRHYFILGRRLSRNGELKLGRKYFKKVAQTYPIDIKSYLFYLLSFSSHSLYNFLLKIYRKIRTLVD